MAFTPSTPLHIDIRRIGLLEVVDYIFFSAHQHLLTCAWCMWRGFGCVLWVLITRGTRHAAGRSTGSNSSLWAQPHRYALISFFHFSSFFFFTTSSHTEQHRKWYHFPTKMNVWQPLDARRGWRSHRAALYFESLNQKVVFFHSRRFDI